MKNTVKKILIYFLCGVLVVTPCFCVCNISHAYSVDNAFDDIVGVIGDNVHSAIDFVGNTTDTAWRVLNRTVDNIGNILAPQRNMYEPSIPASVPSSPSSTSSYKNYSINYYNVSPSLGDEFNISLSPVVNYSNNNYYDYTTQQYVDVNNTTNVYYNNTTNEYTSYMYETNTFITETYNSIVYTYVDPSTSTVNCYVCAFQLPNGDSSFNYSSGYCKGLYWTYGVTNYNYELDNDSIVAYWRLDGDLRNEVPNSAFTLHYNPTDFDNGKFDLAMRLNASSDMYISHSSGSMPAQYSMSLWHYNGNPDYKATPIGWHYCEFYFDNGVKTLYIDGIKSRVTTDYPSGDIYNESALGGNWSYSSTQYSNIYFNGVSTTSPSSLIHFDACHPLRQMDLIVNGATNASTSDSLFVPLFGGSNINNASRSNLYEDTILEDLPTYIDSYSGYGMNAPQPLHYPPIERDGNLLFLYTSLQSKSYSSSIHLGVKGTTIYQKNIGSQDFAMVVPSFVSWGASAASLNSNRPFLLYHGVRDASKYSVSFSNVEYEFTPNGCLSHVSNELLPYTQSYNLSNDYFDEIIIRTGVTAPSTDYLPVPVSRLELDVGYTAPSDFTSINGIGIQSTVPVNNFRIGGVIPTLAKEGDVWFKLENGYCVNCVQYQYGSWQPVNFGVFDGSTWRNGYTYNFYNLSFDATDYDTGTVPTSVINYYYGDTYNVYNDYFKDNQSDKENAISWWTSLIGLISGAFTAIVPFLTSYLGFLPVWLTVPFLTFIPILLILLIVKIKDIFK